MDNPFLNNGFEQGDQALSLSQMLAYLDGKLSKEEKYRVERLLADDPLLMESMEGLEMMSREERKALLLIQTENENALSGKISEAKAQSGAAASGSGAKVFRLRAWKYASAAAILIAIVGVSIFMFNDNSSDSNLAEVYERNHESFPNELDTAPKMDGELEAESLEPNAEQRDKGFLKPSFETPPPPPPPKLAAPEESEALIVEDRAFQEDYEELAMEEGDALPEKPQPGQTRDNTVPSYSQIPETFGSVQEKSLEEAKKEAPAATNYFRENQQYKENLEGDLETLKLEEVDQETLKTTEIATQSKSKRSQTMYRGPNMVLDAQDDEEEKERNSKDFMADAMQQYDAGNYAASIPLFQEVLDLQSNNEAALFYQANAYLNTDQSSAAIKNLKKTLKVKDGAFGEEAEWYLALAYIKAGKEKDARKSLESVIARDGKFKQKAQKALEDLDG